MFTERPQQNFQINFVPWRPILLADISSRLTLAEQAVVAATNGAANKLQQRLNDVIAAYDSAMIAAGYTVAPPPNMVDRFRNHVMAHTIAEWLRDTPLSSAATKSFWTEARQNAHKEASDMLLKIANKQAGAIEDPNGYQQTGNWSSNSRLIMRTEPVVPPQLQFSTLGLGYPWTANPNAAPYPVPDQIPIKVGSLIAWQSNVIAGQLILTWIGLQNALSYNILRGTSSGAETQYSTSTSNIYTDTGCTIGTTYFYQVSAVNEIGTGPLSNESSALSIPTVAMQPPAYYIYA